MSGFMTGTELKGEVSSSSSIFALGPPIDEDGPGTGEEPGGVAGDEFEDPEAWEGGEDGVSTVFSEAHYIDMTQKPLM